MTQRICLLTFCICLLTSVTLAADTRPELSKALDYGHAMFIVYRLNPNTEDLALLLQTSRNVVRLTTERENERAAALVKASGDMKTAREALLKGQPVPEATRLALSKLADAEAEADDLMYGEIRDEIRDLQERLSDESHLLVNWTLPPDYPVPPDEEEALNRLQEGGARIEDCADLIEGMRYLDGAMYLTLRVERLERFLEDHGYDLESPEAEAAYLYLVQLMDEMRTFREEQWEQGRIYYAVRALAYVGGLEEDVATPENETLFGFWDIYDFLRDPQTPELLSKLLNALKTNQGGGE